MADWGKVLDITEYRTVGSTGKLERRYRIQAQSKGGTVFTVEVPEDMSTTEKADPVLKHRAAELDGIKKL